MLHLYDNAGIEIFRSGQFCKVQAVSGQENVKQWIFSCFVCEEDCSDFPWGPSSAILGEVATNMVQICSYQQSFSERIAEKKHVWLNK